MPLKALALSAALLVGQADPLQDLRSPVYKERETAMKHFRENMNDELAKHLEKLLDHESLEVSRRAELLLQPWYEKKAYEVVEKIKTDCRGKLPCLDFLPFDLPDRSAQLRRVDYAKGGPPDWMNYREGTEAYLLDLARQKVPTERIQALVERMKVIERQWIKSCGKHYTPPITDIWEK